MSILFEASYPSGDRIIYHHGGQTYYYRPDHIIAWQAVWASNWTHFISYTFQNNNYLFLYKKGIGTACLSKVSQAGETELWRANWAADWETFSIDLTGATPKLVSVKPAKTDHDLLSETGHDTIATFKNSD